MAFTVAEATVVRIASTALRRVVILGIWRLTGGRAGMPAHYAERKLGVLDIFSEYS
jgi:hypothetical protein